MHHQGVKIFAYLLLVAVVVSGCKLRPDNGVISTAAVHFAGVFISQHIPSEPNLRIQKAPDVKADSNDVYRINGLVEGFTSYNTPLTVEHFSETLHYLGGNPNEITSWECVEIYIGKKKLK